MLDPVHDECGIAAIYQMGHGTDNMTIHLPDILIDLQNRGQLAAGITRYDADPLLLKTYKGVGSVNDVFHLTHPDSQKMHRLMSQYTGRGGIGHVRYATCGKDDPDQAQPFERRHGRRWKWFAFCFNGNVTNFNEVKAGLEEEDYHLRYNNDTELLMHHIAYALRGERKPNFVDVFAHVADKIDGAYSLAFLNADGDLVLARDPNGFRPLCYAVKGDVFAAASESTPLANQGFSDIKDLGPGELLYVNQDGYNVHRFADSRTKSFCFFEHVYFANIGSRLEGESVYKTRRRLGEALARGETENPNPCDSIAVPVPDTAKPACDGMAFKLGIPSREGLIRNRYVGRTFIEGNDRAKRANRKYSVLPEVVEGKRVFLVEDSIVRSTTLRVIVGMLRDAKVKEVHVRVTCPPIIAPCMYGIDMSSIDELLVPNRVKNPVDITQEEYANLAKELGVDTLRYLTVDEMKTAINDDGLCLGCVTAKYPTEWGNKLYQCAKGKKSSGRICEGESP